VGIKSVWEVLRDLREQHAVAIAQAVAEAERRGAKVTAEWGGWTITRAFRTEVVSINIETDGTGVKVWHDHAWIQESWANLSHAFMVAVDWASGR